jgi:hypothetical protein
MTQKELFEKIDNKLNVYEDLLWIARVKPENYHSIPECKKNFDRISEQHPEAVNQLFNDESNWTHGFNSGLVAALRYVLEMKHYGIEFAEENFPNLDS